MKNGRKTRDDFLNIEIHVNRRKKWLKQEQKKCQIKDTNQMSRDA